MAGLARRQGGDARHVDGPWQTVHISKGELKKTLRHAKLAGAVKSTKETAKATTPFVRREKNRQGSISWGKPFARFLGQFFGNWKEVQVQERGKEPRHISSNDRFRFVINNEMLLRDSTVATLSKSDPKVLVLSRAWEYDMSSKPEIRIWWMPQITEDEVEQRHQQKMKREKKLRSEAKLARKSAERVAYFADMFDETGYAYFHRFDIDP